MIHPKGGGGLPRGGAVITGGRSLSPLSCFALAATIERQLEAIYALANHRQSPALAANGAPDRAAAPPSPPARRRGRPRHLGTLR
jgi:hypothetical protein